MISSIPKWPNKISMTMIQGQAIHESQAKIQVESQTRNQAKNKARNRTES